MRRRTNSPTPPDPWNTALRLLTRRDYGTVELQRRLLEKGFDSEAIDQVVARCRELGYLDDARYAERLTRVLLETGRAAGPRLAMELRRRGLPEELIGKATAESREAGGEEAALHDLVVRRFASFNFVEADPGERRRVVSYLQRRGFPLDCILNELKRTDR